MCREIFSLGSSINDFASKGKEGGYPPNNLDDKLCFAFPFYKKQSNKKQPIEFWTHQKWKPIEFLNHKKKED